MTDRAFRKGQPLWLSRLEKSLHRPAAHAFTYPAFCLRLPLSRLPALDAAGIACNRRGAVSFHDRDHGPRDGGALLPWIRELLTLYSAFREARPSPLAPLPVEYSDFARWQSARLRGPRLTMLLDFWRRRLDGAAHPGPA